MSTCTLTKLGFATAMLASWTAVSNATDVVRAPAYGLAPPIFGYYWTGFYGGGHLGVGWSDGASGFLGGGQAGFNYQINQWVLGVEGQISGTSIKNSVSGVFFVPGGGFGTASAN